jgi:hypothetical protein
MSIFSRAFTVPGTADKRAGQAAMDSTKGYAEDLAAGGLTDAMRAYLNQIGAQNQQDFGQMANLLGQKYQGMGLGNSSFAGNALSQLANNAGESMTQARVGLLPMMEENQRYGNQLLYGMGQDQYERGQAAGDAVWNGVGGMLGTAANMAGGGMLGGWVGGRLGMNNANANPNPASQIPTGGSPNASSRLQIGNGLTSLAQYGQPTGAGPARRYQLDYNPFRPTG